MDGRNVGDGAAAAADDADGPLLMTWRLMLMGIGIGAVVVVVVAGGIVVVAAGVAVAAAVRGGGAATTTTTTRWHCWSWDGDEVVGRWRLTAF